MNHVLEILMMLEARVLQRRALCIQLVKRRPVSLMPLYKPGTWTDIYPRMPLESMAKTGQRMPKLCVNYQGLK